MGSVLPWVCLCLSLRSLWADRDSSYPECFVLVFERESKIGWVLCHLASDLVMRVADINLKKWSQQHFCFWPNKAINYKKNSPKTEGPRVSLFSLNWYLYKVTPSFTPPTSSLNDSPRREKPLNCSLTRAGEVEAPLSPLQVLRRFTWTRLGNQAGCSDKKSWFSVKRGKLNDICKQICLLYLHNFLCFLSEWLKLELSINFVFFQLNFDNFQWAVPLVHLFLVVM